MNSRNLTCSKPAEGTLPQTNWARQKNEEWQAHRRSDGSNSCRYKETLFPPYTTVANSRHWKAEHLVLRVTKSSDPWLIHREQMLATLLVCGRGHLYFVFFRLLEASSVELPACSHWPFTNRGPTSCKVFPRFILEKAVRNLEVEIHKLKVKYTQNNSCWHVPFIKQGLTILHMEDCLQEKIV